jgi:hypothetical protein
MHGGGDDRARRRTGSPVSERRDVHAGFLRLFADADNLQGCSLACVFDMTIE